MCKLHGKPVCVILEVERGRLEKEERGAEVCECVCMRERERVS